MGEPVPEWQTSLDFNATRDNGGGGGENYIVSQKKVGHFYFSITLANVDQFL